MTNSATKAGWWIVAILALLALLFFVALANGWVSIPASSAPPRARGGGPFPYLLVGGIVSLVAFVDVLLIVWIVRRRRAKTGS